MAGRRRFEASAVRPQLGGPVGCPSIDSDGPDSLGWCPEKETGCRFKRGLSGVEFQFGPISLDIPAGLLGVRRLHSGPATESGGVGTQRRRRLQHLKGLLPLASTTILTPLGRVVNRLGRGGGTLIHRWSRTLVVVWR